MAEKRLKQHGIISNDRAGVSLWVNADRSSIYFGQMELKMSSAVLAGRGQIGRLANWRRLSETQLRRAVAVLAANLALRSNEVYGDNFDEVEAMKKGDDALLRLIHGTQKVGMVGEFTTFDANAPVGASAVRSNDMVRRASTDDPLTKDALRGKNWDTSQ